MATAATIIVKNINGDVIAVDNIPLSKEVASDLLVETKMISTPSSRPRRKVERDHSPLHPKALVLADLKVGMRIHVHYTGDCPWAQSYDAIVVGEPTTDDKGFQVVPLVRLDVERYTLGFTADMGLVRSSVTRKWNSYWYTVAK